MLEDIYLDEQRTFRNGTASVAVDAALRPHVLFPVGESTGRDGFYASPDPAGGSADNLASFIEVRRSGSSYSRGGRECLYLNDHYSSSTHYRSQ